MVQVTRIKNKIDYRQSKLKLTGNSFGLKLSSFLYFESNFMTLLNKQGDTSHEFEKN